MTSSRSTPDSDLSLSLKKNITEKMSTDSLTKNRVVKGQSDSRPANGGDGTYSYSKNSYYQKLSANVEKQKIDEEIAEKLDIPKITSSSSIIRIADLGCSVGPNTFWTVQNIIEAIEKKYKTNFSNSPLPEFQVFFNDQASNDFNTLFLSLPPDRRYFVAGVPGSFHDQIFPDSSIHFVHTAYAVHWLSTLPKELQDKDSPAWNKGRVHYTSAPNEVLKAYASQFAQDMGNFLTARANEMVAGGILVIITSGISKDIPISQVPSGIMHNCIASCFMDMSKEGLVREDEVDSFNLPFYSPTTEDIMEVVERNGHFRIERMELTDPASWLEGYVDIRVWITHVRAAMEATFTKHFGIEVVNELFERVVIKLSEFSDQIHSNLHEKFQLFVVLKRRDEDV